MGETIIKAQNSRQAINSNANSLLFFQLFKHLDIVKVLRFKIPVFIQPPVLCADFILNIGIWFLFTLMWHTVIIIYGKYGRQMVRLLPGISTLAV